MTPASTSRRARPRAVLKVDWPNCKGHGLCHELLPELIDLDEWGYPVISPAGVRRGQLDDARRAVSACPVLALRLIEPTRR